MQEKNIKFLEKRIKELEEKVSHLRFSRRVLMNLVEKIEKEKWYQMSKLEKENKKLQYNNYKYAKSLLYKNRQIMELESKLNLKNTNKSDFKDSYPQNYSQNANSCE